MLHDRYRGHGAELHQRPGVACPQPFHVEIFPFSQTPKLHAAKALRNFPAGRLTRGRRWNPLVVRLWWLTRSSGARCSRSSSFRSSARASSSQTGRADPWLRPCIRSSRGCRLRRLCCRPKTLTETPSARRKASVCRWCGGAGSSTLGPSGWQCGKSFSEVQRWNRIEAVSQMKTPWRSDAALRNARGNYDIISPNSILSKGTK